MIRLVLASASPARLATLRRAGVEPLVVVSAVDEDAAAATAGARAAPDVALILARAKAEDVAADVTGALVLGCDSVFDVDGEVRGKPPSPEAARAWWAGMSGGAGVLHTGHWLIDTRAPADGGTGAALGAVAATVVRFGSVDAHDIDAYVATGEPLRVAGAFTVDGLGAPYSDSIDGDVHTVVGLGLPLLRRLLGDLGVHWHDLR